MSNPVPPPRIACPGLITSTLPFPVGLGHNTHPWANFAESMPSADVPRAYWSELYNTDHPNSVYPQSRMPSLPICSNSDFRDFSALPHMIYFASNFIISFATSLDFRILDKAIGLLLSIALHSLHLGRHSLFTVPLSLAAAVLLPLFMFCFLYSCRIP
ncbi:hypothetical protein HGRIS_000071 [Hohenbuehelia grisea]|uniref:Uncharacterized protein n=1 Tax=Hohenbuehelia grisea TaxID=104357 RepID=A0ABR3JPZ1_9AGAR